MKQRELLEEDNVLRCYFHFKMISHNNAEVGTVCYYNGKRYYRSHFRKGGPALTERSAMNMIVKDLTKRGHHIENIKYDEIGVG